MSEQFITFGAGHNGSIQSASGGIDNRFNERDRVVRIIHGNLVRRRSENSDAPIESVNFIETFNVRRYVAKNLNTYLVAWRDDYGKEITDEMIERAIEAAQGNLKPIG